MPRKKKRKSPSFFKIIFWLAVVIAIIYAAVRYFMAPPDIFYPGFEINIPQGYEIHGIDVSKYQEVINWKDVKEMNEKGIRIGFVFIKATEGTSLVDAQFQRNWIESENQHITRGAYHFYVSNRSAQKQADNFIQMVNLKPGDLPPVLDVEKSHGVSVAAMQKGVKLWLSEIENHYGVKPVIYTNIDFYRRYFQAGFEDYPLWIAHYLQPQKPRIERTWLFWQHSEKGRVNGIRTMVDFNVFNGDSADFRNFLLPPSP